MNSRSGLLGIVTVMAGFGMVVHGVEAGEPGAKPPAQVRGQATSKAVACTPKEGGEQLTVYGIGFDTTLKEAQKRLCTMGHRYAGHTDTIEIKYKDMRAFFHMGRLAALRVDKPVKDVHSRDIYADLRQRFGMPDHLLKQEPDKEYLEKIDYESDKNAEYAYQLCWGMCNKIYVGGPQKAKTVLRYSGKDSGYFLASVREQYFSIDMRNADAFAKMQRHLKGHQEVSMLSGSHVN